MNCCDFENEITRYIPTFAGFTEFTSSIPKLYWNVKSQEQRIFAICKMLNKVICYADMLGDNVNEIKSTLQDILDGKLDPMIEAAIAEWFEEHEQQIVAEITELQQQVLEINTTIGNMQDEFGQFEDTTNAAIAEANENLEKAEFVLAPHPFLIQPGYIGSFTKYSGLYKILNSPDDDPIYTQGFCMINDTTMRFFTVNKQDTVAHIDTAVLGTNELQLNTRRYVGFGHCNQVCYNPELQRYYLNIGSDITQQYLYSTIVLDSSFNEITRLETPNGVNYFGPMLYDKVTGNMYWVGGYDIYSFDPVTNTFTKLNYKLSELISAGATLQGAALYNNYLVCPVTNTQINGYAAGLKVYDIRTGEKLKTFNFTSDNGYYPIGEVEGCDFDSQGNLYIQSIACYDTSERYYSETIVSRCNIFEGEIEGYHPYYSSQPQTICVEVDNYHGFTSTGSNAYPCKSLEEASLMAQVLPKVRKIMLGGESNYSTTEQQTWFGILQLTGIMTTVHFAGNGQIRIRGAILIRDNAVLKLRNRATFFPPYNYNGAIIRAEDSIVLAAGISTGADATAQTTLDAVVRCTGTGMLLAQYVNNDIGATVPVSNYNAGFGYVLGNPKSGTW